jgi:hypothetical protein
VAICQAIERNEWCIQRSSSLLSCLDQLLEVHLQFFIFSACGLDEYGAVLRALVESCVKQRLQSLP